jgi:hypothetical protein
MVYTRFIGKGVASFAEKLWRQGKQHGRQMISQLRASLLKTF